MPRPRSDKPTYSLTKRATSTGSTRYYVQWWEAGSAHRVSCRTSQHTAARRFLAEFEAGRAMAMPPDAPTIGAVLDGYRAQREKRPVSPTLGYNIARLKSWLGDLPANMMTEERTEFYIRKRQKTGAGGAPSKHREKPKPLADSTLRRELLTLRTALVWAQKKHWISEAPHIDAPPAGAPRDRWLTRDEANRLLRSADHAHVKVFLALALYTAGRAGAILDLTWDRVDFEFGWVDLGESQGNKRRAKVPMHPKLRPVLVDAERAKTSAYVVERGGGRVESVKKGFHNATIRAALPGVTPHVLRHTAATWMAQRGVSLERIAAYLGNSAATVERVYAHHTPEHMAEALAALSD